MTGWVDDYDQFFSDPSGQFPNDRALYAWGVVRIPVSPKSIIDTLTLQHY